jgi:hypothetical protein
VSEFVRASHLYDVQAGERVEWDWSKMQPLAVSNYEIGRTVEAATNQEG